MVKLKQTAIILGSICLFLLTSCKSEKKNKLQNSVNQQEITSEKGERKILFENDYATVVKIQLKPGQFISPPSGNKAKTRVIYSLTDYLLDWKNEDGKMETKKWKQGDIHSHEAGDHYVINKSNTIAEWLVFIKKNKSLPTCGENTIRDDVNSVSPEFSQTLFDNKNFKITKVSLPKGERISTHSGINRLIYSLSDYELMYESDSKDQVDKKFKVKEIHWHEASKHAFENTGETEAKFLVVSYYK